MAGPYLQAEPSLQFTGTTNLTNWQWNILGELDGGLGFQVNILDHQLLNYYMQLLHYQWVLASDSGSIATPPSIPILLSPPNNAINQPLNPTLTWSSSDSATDYQLQVATNDSFSTTILDQSGITATSQQIFGLSYSTDYYWRVRANNSAGNSNWTTPWKFTTLVTLPATPILLSPPDGTVIQQNYTTLSWSKPESTTVDFYELQVVVEGISGWITIIDDSCDATFREIDSLTHGTMYYWQVRAHNQAEYGAWTGLWEFTVELAPPNLFYPPNNSINIPVFHTYFEWYSSSGACSYETTVATDPNFNNICWTWYCGMPMDTLIYPWLQFQGPAWNTTYYWHVKAIGCGVYSDFSECWTFTTQSQPP